MSKILGILCFEFASARMLGINLVSSKILEIVVPCAPLCTQSKGFSVIECGHVEDLWDLCNIVNLVCTKVYP